ncbi:MAG: NAD-dependent epimerase/dehydratase family protein [Saprospiraceae bacterium]
MKKALVCGSGGFIGGHLTKRLKGEGYWVRGVDIKKHDFENDHSDEFILGDLRKHGICKRAIKNVDVVFQLAADMGGAGYLFTGDNDAEVMHNSALINLNILDLCRSEKISKIFYSSSACVYPQYNQEDPESPICTENTVYPAQPDSEYGWEKLFSERLYLTYAKNHNIDVKVARFHNIFGPKGTWRDGREKAPAAICRKVAVAKDGGTIEIWGDGLQTRSFLCIDECIEGIWRLINSEFRGPVNIGSDELISINDFAKMIIKLSGKNIQIKHTKGPIGVKGRTSDNTLIFKELGWAPKLPLEQGIMKTYDWVFDQVKRQ